MALICNDSGKVDGLPLNRSLEDYDIIAGNFFICGFSGEKFCSLTDKQADFMPPLCYNTSKWGIAARRAPVVLTTQDGSKEYL